VFHTRSVLEHGSLRHRFGTTVQVRVRVVRQFRPVAVAEISDLIGYVAAVDTKCEPDRQKGATRRWVLSSVALE
jgi:hypothetical protein